MPRKQHYVIIIIFFIISCFHTRVAAQQYKGAVGGRFGYGIGLTGVYMLQNGHGFEFLLRYGYHGLILNKPGANVQVLYQKHWELGRSGAWTTFLGTGPSFGYGKKTSQSKQQFFALGFSPQFGFDYTTQRLRIPIVFALDYKPTFNADFPVKNKSLKVGTDFSFYEVAISVRFAIGQNNNNSYRRRR